MKNNVDSIVPSCVSSDIDNEILLLSDQRCSNEVQQTIVNDSNTNDLSNRNIPSSEECETQKESVDVPVRVSFDHIDDCALLESNNCMPDDTLITRLKNLKEQVSIYEQRSKFELTERE